MRPDAAAGATACPPQSPPVVVLEQPLQSLSSPENQLPMVSILGVSECRPPPLNSDDSNASMGTENVASDEAPPCAVVNRDLVGGELEMPDYDELELTSSELEVHSEDDD